MASSTGTTMAFIGNFLQAKQLLERAKVTP